MSRPIIQCHVHVLAGLLPAALLSLLIPFAGCGLFEANEDSGPAIRTDKRTYTLSQSGETLTGSFDMTYTNQTGDPTHLVTCNGIFSILLEKLIDGKWVLAYGSDSPDCLGPIISIEPGRQHTNSLKVAAFTPSSEYEPKFQVDNISGTYRLVWPIYERLNPNGYQEESGWGKLLPLEKRVSNTFEISQ
ncbi:MAG: hypothetical protein ACREOO_00165 [bacterium]